MIRVLPAVALLLVALSSTSSLAQLTPPAGSAGAGNSSISGIPAGPANNPTVYDPSGIGNAGRSPSLPSQAAIPVTPASPGFGNTVLTPRTGARPARVRAVRRAEIRAPRSDRRRPGSRHCGAEEDRQQIQHLQGLLRQRDLVRDLDHSEPCRCVPCLTNNREIHMRKFILIAAMAFASATSALAGDSRSLSLTGVDEKVPAALGKAAGAPKIVEAPKPPDPPKPPDTPQGCRDGEAR